VDENVDEKNRKYTIGARIFRPLQQNYFENYVNKDHYHSATKYMKTQKQETILVEDLHHPL
jgi:hypothetical protein